MFCFEESDNFRGRMVGALWLTDYNVFGWARRGLIPLLSERHQVIASNNPKDQGKVGVG